MISVDKFSLFLYEQLLKPLSLYDSGFFPSFSTNIKDFMYSQHCQDFHGSAVGRCIWWHEEPLNYNDLDDVRYFDAYHTNKIDPYHCTESYIWPSSPLHPSVSMMTGDTNFHLLANSEISQQKRKYLREWGVADWYFFFHGFAALDWYRNYKYLDYSYIKPTKLFICLNHLLTNNRNYRLYLLSVLQQRDLKHLGHVSAPLLSKQLVKTEVLNTNSKLSTEAKKHIYQNLSKQAEPTILDTVDYNNASADLTSYGYDALWHVVTETVYFDNSLHLTEKIFKPIVSKRPFILVGAPGNLAYLKRYGFKTFDQWIDESYDQESNPTLRTNMIAEQLYKLKHKSVAEQHEQMQEVLEYNHQHFYGKFREIIVDELLGNFKKQVNWYNHDRIKRHRLPIDRINFQQVRNLMLS
jgi:hypothetical protein